MYIISTKTIPSGPVDVQVSVVSDTEIGVVWDVPKFSGGLKIRKYLVEWDTSSTFNNCKVSPTNHYYNYLDGPVVRSAVVTETKYQITGLQRLTKHYTRVSTFNDRGYSGAVSSTPLSVITRPMPLYLSSDVLLSVSKHQIPNRLYVEWSLPKENELGFITDIEACGVSTGHTTKPANAYLLSWDRDPKMNKNVTYRMPMLNNDGQLTCCANKKCSLEIGTEVQSRTIKSDTGDKFKYEWALSSLFEDSNQYFK